MSLTLKEDLQGVDWERLAAVYRTAFGTALIRWILEALPPHAAVVLAASEPHLVDFSARLSFRRLKIAHGCDGPALPSARDGMSEHAPST